MLYRAKSGIAVVNDNQPRHELLEEVGRLRKRIGELESVQTDLEKKNRALIEHSPVCTKIIDLDFTLRYMSNAGVDSLKIADITKYYGAPYPLDFYPEPFRTAMTEKLQRAKNTGEVVTLEAALLDTDDNELWFHSTLVPVRGDDGRVEYIMVVSVNTTDRKRAEADRLTMERQVQHAQKLESLGVLAGGIAHDFNNILVGILGNANLAIDVLPATSAARPNLQNIEIASQRAADLARQMLAYSGRGKFVVEPIDIGEVVRETAQLLDVAISKKVELRYQLAEDLPAFDGDLTQVRQIVMNLITNAADAIGDNRGQILLSTSVMECDRAYLERNVERADPGEPAPEGPYLCVEVTDSGCGMSAETLERLFDPFFTTKSGGRGLGMSAVLGIVRGHTGVIKVDSEVGRGTTFKVLFPASDHRVVRATSPDKDPAPAKEGTEQRTILVVDDEETIRAVATLMLQRLGFKVLTANDGREAVSIFAENADGIDCVLLDLTMPDMDGGDTLTELRRLRSGIRVILCSGYNEHATVADGDNTTFLQKPFGLRELGQSVASCLSADH